MFDKTIVITGGNAGIGKMTAIALAKKGGKIIIVGRNAGRLNTAKDEIIQKSNNSNIDTMLCDFSSIQSILEFGKSMELQYHKIDVLINNVGAMFGKRQTTVDGLENTFALNHLGYFLTTHCLLNLIKKGSQSRIINVSSGAHGFAKTIDWNDLQSEQKYDQMKVYGQSKLFNIYFTKILAQKLKADNITVNALHPGMVNTDFGKGGSWLVKALLPLGRLFMISVEQGAATSIYLASSPEIANISGEYFVKRKPSKISTLAKNKDNAQILWDKSLALCQIETFGTLS